MSLPTPLAPELSDQLQWINAEPIELGACAGKVRVVLFFNQGAAYCQNLVDTLHHLLLKHRGRLQVVGLHLPKFPFEREPARIAEAVSRLGIRFPVASDVEYVAWQHYGVRGWPSMVVIDAGGVLRETLVGDLDVDGLESALMPWLEEVPPMLDDQLDTTLVGRRSLAGGALHHPCGIAVAERRLYIADTGHHQIVECTAEGRVLTRYGTGSAGLVDGPPDECGFNAPHGLFLARNLLYVADSGNHALRQIDLHSGEVTTVAGTGEAGAPDRALLHEPRQCRLDRPWALAGNSEHLFVSLAGLNQIWALDLATGGLVHKAGSGELAVEDGPALQASFAQPAGLSLLQKTLYVADASGSALRSLSLGTGEVRTLLGRGLFSFGAEDGVRERASLCAPHGLVLQADAPVLWVADSGNDRLRTLRLGGGSVASAGFAHPLRRPLALAAGEGALWVANTDAHEILRLDLASGELVVIGISDPER